MMCPSPLATICRDEIAGSDAGYNRIASSLEPRLREIMNDPMTHRLMASDGVERDHLCSLLMETRAKLAIRRS